MRKEAPGKLAGGEGPAQAPVGVGMCRGGTAAARAPRVRTHAPAGGSVKVWGRVSL